MNNTELYYNRIIETFVDEYKGQLTDVKEGHCMKVVGLPFDVLENLYNELMKLGTSLRIFILAEDKAGERYITATKLIELRNDLTQSILVLIPVNVSTAAEDSYGNATFKELSIAHLNDRLLSNLRKEVQDNETIKAILDFLTSNTPKQKVLDYLLYVIENNLDESVIGKGLYKLGIIPDSEIVHRPAVKFSHGLLCLELLPDEWHEKIVAHCPQELLEIHRIHLYGILFRGNENILHILLDGYQ